MKKASQYHSWTMVCIYKSLQKQTINGGLLRSENDSIDLFSSSYDSAFAWPGVSLVKHENCRIVLMYPTKTLSSLFVQLVARLGDCYSKTPACNVCPMPLLREYGTISLKRVSSYYQCAPRDCCLCSRRRQCLTLGFPPIQAEGVDTKTFELVVVAYNALH